MVSGAVCYTLLASFNLQPAGLHPIVPSLLLSLLAFYLGNVVGESAGRRHHYPLEENCYALDPTQTEHHRQPGGRPERRAGGKRRRVGDLRDTHDNPVFEPLPGETLLWGDTDVIGLYDAETDMAEVVAMLEQHPLLGAGFRHKIEQLEDKDWEREWMDNFHPMRFGERLWICPSWRDVPDPDAVNVMLDPGGVRHRYPPDHGAVPAVAGRPRSGRQNRYRLRLRFRHPGNRRPEAGCSARYRHRYRSPAIQASRDNAQRNGVSERLELYLPKDQPADLLADVVVANILAGPLRELAPLIGCLPKAGGHLGLSGVLASRASSVAQAYEEVHARPGRRA